MMTEQNHEDHEDDGEEQEGQDQATATVELADVDLDRVKNMVKADLIALAEALDLPADGKVEDLRKRIAAKKLGGDKHHVHGGTLCPSCGNVAVVTHTVPGKFRRIKCRHCSYRGKVAW